MDITSAYFSLHFSQSTMKLCIPAKGFSICQNQFKAVKGSRRLFSSSLIVKSKIGKQPVKLPSSITVTVSDCQVSFVSIAHDRFVAETLIYRHLLNLICRHQRMILLVIES